MEYLFGIATGVLIGVLIGYFVKTKPEAEAKLEGYTAQEGFDYDRTTD